MEGLFRFCAQKPAPIFLAEAGAPERWSGEVLEPAEVEAAAPCEYASSVCFGSLHHSMIEAALSRAARNMRSSHGSILVWCGV